MNECVALFDVLLELGNRGIKELLLLARDLAERVDVLDASRAEDGCLEYSYGEDVLDPGLIRVFEVWRDQAALDAHFASEHIAAWRAHGQRFGVSDRRLFAYEIASERRL